MVNEIFLTNSISSLLVFFTCLYLFSKKEKEHESIFEVILLIGLLNLAFFTIDLLGYLKVFEVLTQDPLIINLGFYLFLQSTLIVLLVYFITKNRLLVASFIFLATPSLIINYGLEIFFLVLALISSFLTFFSAVALYNNKEFRKPFYYILGLSLFKIFTIFIFSININFFKLTFPLLNLVLILFLLTLTYHLKCKKEYKEKSCLEEKNDKEPTMHIITRSLGQFLFIISIIAFIFIGAISLHEFGHAIIAKYLGCDFIEIVIYKTMGSPHTELSCPALNQNNPLLLLGGLIFTIVLALILYLSKSRNYRTISHLLIGISLLIAYQDLLDLNMPLPIVLIISLISLFIVGYAIMKLTHYHLNQFIT